MSTTPLHPLATLLEHHFDTPLERLPHEIALLVRREYFFEGWEWTIMTRDEKRLRALSIDAQDDPVSANFTNSAMQRRMSVLKLDREIKRIELATAQPKAERPDQSKLLNELKRLRSLELAEIEQEWTRSVAAFKTDQHGESSKIHSSRRRRNTLSPVVELAQKACVDATDVAEVWNALKRLASTRTYPLLGVTEDEHIQYDLDGGEPRYLTRDALSKRLKRSQNPRQ